MRNRGLRNAPPFQTMSPMHVQTQRGAVGERGKPVAGGGGFSGEVKRKKRGRTRRAYDSVSKQKKRSHGRRQPMGCGCSSTEWEMVEGWGRRAVLVR